MKAIIVLVLLGLSGSAWAQNQAPFCVVTGYGTQCRFWNADSCRQAAASTNGMCVANSQQQQTVQQQYPNIAQSYQQGYQFGAQQRQAREEHEARMRLLEAQTQAAAAQAPQAYTPAPPQASEPEYFRVVYDCQQDGSVVRTMKPRPGCVVVSVFD